MLIILKTNRSVNQNVRSILQGPAGGADAERKKTGSTAMMAMLPGGVAYRAMFSD